MITDWTSMFPEGSDEYWPELQQQIDYWEQRISDDPGMFNQLVFGLMVATHQAEAAEAALAAVPVEALKRTLLTGYRTDAQITADADAINAWLGEAQP